MKVVKDLVPDLSKAYKQLQSINPWLHRKEKNENKDLNKLKSNTDVREKTQSPDERSKLDGKWECVLC